MSQLNVKLSGFDPMEFVCDTQTQMQMLKHQQEWTSVFTESRYYKDLHCFTCSKDFKFYMQGMMFGSTESWCVCPFCDALKLIIG